MIKEQMFRFEIEQKPFSWDNQRPTPPQGYIEFNSHKAHCQAGKCPNCGDEKPGIGPGKRDGGFQNREIQNLCRNLECVNKRLNIGHPNWKPEYELFSKDLFPEKEKYQSMIKCHPTGCYGTTFLKIESQ